MRKSSRCLALILAAVMIIAMFPMTVSAATSKPGAVKISSFKVDSVSQYTNTTTVRIKWKRAKNATGYWVYELQPNGKWEVLKKLGKNYVGINISSVYAGQRGFKVCAVRKVGKKTYKGKFAVKKKFIKSPLNFEELCKVEGVQTSSSESYEQFTYSFSAKGNDVTYIYDFYAAPDADTLSSIHSEIKKEAVNLVKNAKKEGGVKGVTVTAYVKNNGTILDTIIYPEP